MIRSAQNEPTCVGMGPNSNVRSGCIAMARASVILVATVVSCVSIVDVVTRAEPTNNLINKVRELRAALRACWIPPSLAHEDIAISVRLSFKQNGEILGVP